MKSYEQYCLDKNVKRPYPDFYNEYCRGFIEGEQSLQSELDTARKEIEELKEQVDIFNSELNAEIYIGEVTKAELETRDRRYYDLQQKHSALVEGLKSIRTFNQGETIYTAPFRVCYWQDIEQLINKENDDRN